ncbi:4a-hydroxytetrahydrobiopterin dehydratase [Kaarinaea lacus]
MTNLVRRSCKQLPSDTPPLPANEIEQLLQQLHGDWSVQQQPPELQRSLRFKNYYHTMAFVNALAWVAHQEDHHPDLEVSYNRCVVHFSTHSIGGISENDFICAAKLDALLANQTEDAKTTG